MPCGKLCSATQNWTRILYNIRGKRASRFLIQREPYRERHDLKTYVQLKIPATTTRTVAIQNII